MTTAEDFLLLMTDPITGKISVPAMAREPAIGGAILFDLVTAGRLAPDGEGRKARVTVVDQSPLTDALLQDSFQRVRHQGRQTPKSIVSRLGRKGVDRTYQALVSHGAVRRREARAFGIFRLSRHEVIDAARRDDLLVRIRTSLLLDQPVDSQTGPLIGILSAADLVRYVVDKPDRRRAKDRAKEISAGDWASEGVRKAIEAAHAAIAAVTIAAAASGVAGSN